VHSVRHLDNNKTTEESFKTNQHLAISNGLEPLQNLKIASSISRSLNWHHWNKHRSQWFMSMAKSQWIMLMANSHPPVCKMMYLKTVSSPIDKPCRPLSGLVNNNNTSTALHWGRLTCTQTFLQPFLEPDWG